MKKDELNKKLIEKFNELSELFTLIKEENTYSPEQRCCVIKTMIDIYKAIDA